MTIFVVYVVCIGWFTAIWIKVLVQFWLFLLYIVSCIHRLVHCHESNLKCNFNSFFLCVPYCVLSSSCLTPAGPLPRIGILVQFSNICCVMILYATFTFVNTKNSTQIICIAAIFIISFKWGIRNSHVYIKSYTHWNDLSSCCNSWQLISSLDDTVVFSTWSCFCSWMLYEVL